MQLEGVINNAILTHMKRPYLVRYLAHICVIFSSESLPDKNDNPRGLVAGSGEVIASWHLSKALHGLQIDAEIVRSTNALRLLTHTNTVFVFLGSSLNLTLERLFLADNELQRQQNFVFDWQGPDAVILDKKTGATWLNQGFPVSSEKQYALISLLHKEVTKQTILCISGTSTIGTQAAARFVSDNSMIETVFRHMSSDTNVLKPFQMVLETEVHYEEPYATQPVAWHPKLKTT